MGFGTVATAWYFFYWFWNCCDSVVFFSIGFGTVATAWYFLYFFYWFWNCCDHATATVQKPKEKIARCRNSYKTNRKKYKKYHAVATVPNPIEKNTKNTTLSQQFQNQ
jgi:hypothetical protein